MKLIIFKYTEENMNKYNCLECAYQPGLKWMEDVGWPVHSEWTVLTETGLVHGVDCQPDMTGYDYKDAAYYFRDYWHDMS